ncbi:hypothetical protein QFZ51_003214 [Chitinophaga sp. W3I9]|uniref:hypothetical protein n=1 Tax=unclassified Chitinophaga TaxID=2619133 RepID=UPI003D204271
METIIIAERKRKYIADLIIFAILLAGGLISIIQYSASLPSIIFIVSLIIPSVGIVKYLWDVPSQIKLSEDEMVIYYGRSILEDVDARGSFAFPSIVKLKWGNIADFDVKSYTYCIPDNGGDRGAITTNYEYLIITLSNIDNLNPNSNQRYTVVLNHFEKTPEEILAICKQFQMEWS